MDAIQTKILEKIRSKFRRGDISKVVVRTGFSRRYVGDCLNPEKECYNDDVINAAQQIIAERANVKKSQLKQLNSL